MKPKIETETELTDYNIEISENRKTEVPLSFFQRIKRILSFITVEPFILGYYFPQYLISRGVQQLNIEKACRVDLNYTKEICERLLAGDHSDNVTVTTMEFVANMTAWQVPLQSSFPFIAILFVGAWSDKTGNRKALMLIPCIGELVSVFGLFWSVYFFKEWPLWVTAVIEALPTALSGGPSVAVMGTYSYIADVTTVESRTFRVGVVTVISTLGSPVGMALSGVLAEKLGYYGVLAIGFSLYIVGITYTVLNIHDVKRNKQEGTLAQKVLQFFNPKNAWDTISILFSARGRQRIQIILLICTHIVILGPGVGEGYVFDLYTLYRYGMDVVDRSLYGTYATLVSLAGTTIAVTLFSKYLKMHDAFLGIIATTCRTVCNFVFALAPTRTWFYAGTLFDIFGNAGWPAIRSLGTKVVDPDCVGKMCSLLGLAENLVPFVYSPIYSKLFASTVATLPGAIYLLGGTMTIPAFIMFIVLYIMHRKDLRDVVKNPDAKESHAHDNNVTSF